MDAKPRKVTPARPDPSQDLDACFRYAFQQQEKGNTETAIAAYRAVLEINPGHVLSLFNLGVALEARGADEQAFNHYQAAAKMDPGYAKAQNNIGAMLSRQKRYAEAVAVFEQATATDSGFGEAWANLCNAYNNTGQLEQAIEAGRKAVETAPKLFRAHNNLGVVQLKARQPESAEKSFRAALKIMPDSHLALNNVATALEKQYHYKKAIPFYEKAVRLRPDYVRAHLNFAWSKLSLDRWQDSISLSIKVMSLLAEQTETVVLDPQRARRRVLNDQISRAALHTFMEVCEQHNVQCFLTFGTLLGCLRDGELISYDTDIDLGYWQGTDLMPVLQALPADDFLIRQKPLPGGKADLASILSDTINFSIVYKNRVYLDLYRHWREQDKVRSGFEIGSEPMLYEVSDFELTTTAFLDREFLIPDSKTRYLKECYGDWQTPDPCFETALDSPNLVGGFPPHARALAFYRTAQRLFDGNYVKGFNLLEKLIGREDNPTELEAILARFKSRVQDQAD